VYPPWGEPMYDASLQSPRAISYRVVVFRYSVRAIHLVARFAPPLADETTWRLLGAIAVVLSAVGVVAARTHELGPVWYPIALAVARSSRSLWLGAGPGFRAIGSVNALMRRSPATANSDSGIDW
jgi:hypothetical protein